MEPPFVLIAATRPVIWRLGDVRPRKRVNAESRHRGRSAVNVDRKKSSRQGSLPAVSGRCDNYLPDAALTIATMPALTATGRAGHNSTMACKSRSNVGGFVVAGPTSGPTPETSFCKCLSFKALRFVVG